MFQVSGKIAVLFFGLSTSVLASSVSARTLVTTNSIDLISYTQLHIQAPAVPGSSIAKYNRKQHFGSWIKQDPANGCYDTREEVLARQEDPSTPVAFSASGCTIVSGSWHDPYTGNEVQQASQLQIDHVVPLQNAYYAGAYAWAPQVRCNYANFIANTYHLVAVDGHENMSKGDKGPDSYLPPNKADACEYVSSWMKIKAIWQLTTTAAEFAAEQRVFSDENCDASLRTMDVGEMTAMRAQAANPVAACANFGGAPSGN